MVERFASNPVVLIANQAGQLQLTGAKSCFALGALPGTAFALDTTQSPQVLSVTFAGGLNSKCVALSPQPC